MLHTQKYYTEAIMKLIYIATKLKSSYIGMTVVVNQEVYTIVNIETLE